MAVLSIFTEVVAAAILAAVLFAAGARIRVLLRVPTPPRLRWPIDLALGAWSASTLLLLAGLVGLVDRVTLLALVLALALVGRWRRNGRPWATLAPPAIAGLLTLPVALSPPFFYDALVYHLALPWRALVEGAWRAHPETVFAAFPPLAELLSLPGLAVGLDRVPALLHWLAWVVAGAGVIALARRAGAPPVAARLAGAAVLVLPATPLVPGFPAAEGWLLVGVVPAAALVTTRPRPGTALLAGSLLGIAAAARLQGLPWALVLLSLAALRWRARPRPLTAAAAGLVLGAVPWWAANGVLLGDPLAPLGWHREGLDTLWRDSHSLLRGGRSVLECMTALPRLLSGESAWLLPLALVAVLALIQRPRRAAPLAYASILGVAAWSCTGALPRFLAPTAVLLLAVAALPNRGRLVRGVTLLALGWCAVVGAVHELRWLQRIDLPHLLVTDTAGAVRAMSPNPPTAAFAGAVSLPTRARVLFVAEPRSFGFPRACVVPSQHDPSPLRDLTEGGGTVQEMLARLRTAGYTHLLVNWRELARLGPSYPVAPWRSAAGNRRWRELLRTLGEPVVSADGVQIFELSPESSKQRASGRPEWVPGTVENASEHSIATSAAVPGTPSGAPGGVDFRRTRRPGWPPSPP